MKKRIALTTPVEHPVCVPSKIKQEVGRFLALLLAPEWGSNRLSAATVSQRSAVDAFYRVLGEVSPPRHPHHHKDDPDFKCILKLVTAIIGISGPEREASTGLHQKLMASCYKLIALPNDIVQGDELKLSLARSVILNRTGHKTIAHIEDIFRRNRVNRTANSDTPIAWRRRADAAYQSVHDQCILMVARRIENEQGNSVAESLAVLDTTLSQITACDTALIREYSRLATALSTGTQATDFRTWALNEIALSLIEPGIQSILIDAFEKSGIQFFDAYNRRVSSFDAAIDHHSYYLGHGIAKQLTMSEPQQRDLYCPLQGVEALFSDDRIVSEIQSDISKLLSYTQLVNALIENRELMASYLGAKQMDSEFIIQCLADIGVRASMDDFDDKSTTHFEQLLPVLAHDLLINTGIVDYQDPLVDTSDFPKKFATAVVGQELHLIRSYMGAGVDRKIDDAKVIGLVLKYCRNNGIDPIALACETNSGWLITKCITDGSKGVLERMAAYDADGLTPVHQMIRQGSTAVLSVLAWHDQTRHGFAQLINMRSKQENYSCVMLAADQLQLTSLTFLFKEYSEVARFQSSQQSTDGRTSIHIAALGGDLDCFNAIVSQLPNKTQDKARCLSAFFFQKDQFGKNSLHYAVEGGNVGIVKAIITVSPELMESRIDQPDGLGFDPMAMAVLGKQDAILRVFLSNYWRHIEMRTYTGTDIMGLAASTQDYRIVGSLFHVSDSIDLGIAISRVNNHSRLNSMTKLYCEIDLLHYHRKYVDFERVRECFARIEEIGRFGLNHLKTELIGHVYQALNNDEFKAVLDLTGGLSHEHFSELLSVIHTRIDPETMADHVISIGVNADFRGTDSPKVLKQIFANAPSQYLNQVVGFYFDHINKRVNGSNRFPVRVITTLHFRFSEENARKAIDYVVKKIRDNFGPPTTELVSAFLSIAESHPTQITPEDTHEIACFQTSQQQVEMFAMVPDRISPKTISKYLNQNRFSAESLDVLDLFRDLSDAMVPEIIQESYRNHSFDLSRIDLAVGFLNKIHAYDNPMLLSACLNKCLEFCAPDQLICHLVSTDIPRFSERLNVFEYMDPQQRDVGISNFIGAICQKRGYSNALISALERIRPYFNETIFEATVVAIWSSGETNEVKDAWIETLTTSFVKEYVERNPEKFELM